MSDIFQGGQISGSLGRAWRYSSMVAFGMVVRNVRSNPRQISDIGL
jgi:hypothetical protein